MKKYEAKVLIVEDDPMAAKLFELFITKNPNYKLVNSISNADLVDVYVKSNKIDLIIMDIRTSNRASGLDASKRVKDINKNIKIIVVTSMPEASFLRRAKEIGVEAFWYKDVNEENFTNLVERVVNGEKIFPVSSPNIKLGLAYSSEFTNREIEVLKLIIKGLSNKEIANKLFVTERTVKAHIQNMLLKTGFQNRTELAVESTDSGIISNY